MSGDRFILWMARIFIFIMVCISTLILIILLKELGPAIPSNWDPLAFIGAIVGGFITLFGVRITIKNQRSADFLRDYLKVRTNGDDVHGELDAMTRVIKEYLFGDKYEIHNKIVGVSLAVEDILKGKDALKEKAALVSEKFYDMTDVYLLTISHWKYFLKYENGLDENYLYEKFKREYQQLLAAVMVLEDQMELIREKYKKLSK
ncbi:hypothetical protein PM3016_5454 [Paenibacillus mucilaginosus 3016]|uniref:Uncharacterized protein n=1 Tax=Paenibacillus mucilaginosus 3016 TaxID=1116391 RepID=H6NDV5_9BACL|nr:hypothetical protein [Paenibacillus mucilaginosus]AFC32154.1 hypothetical protein PM3016_5454 [Paenibacillus mucilaginosus 3016]WFA20655.1 hypothetical protein ERY13_27150 [Paenibacillus mucilaginosus]